MITFKALYQTLFGLILIIGQTLHSQVLEGSSFLSNTPASILKTISSEAKYNVDAYKIRYYTTDLDGSQTIASGALMIPVNNACDSFPLAVYDHGTVLEKEDVPSRDNFEALVSKVLASTGAVSVAPDYLGLGDNAGLHPYLHANSQATATVDLIRAAREFIRDSLNITLNEEVYLTGYSQGGHAAMATAKYIEDNSLLAEFNVIGAGPGSGPYNLSGTLLPTLLSNAPYSNPGYVVYLLFAMERVYGNIYNSYSDILDSPYDTLIPPLFDGSVDMSVVNAALPNTVRGFIQDSVLDNLIADSLTRSHPIYLALEANDNFDWSPTIPMELYYCTQDEQVDFQNSLDAETAMQANGANVMAVSKGSLNHGGCFVPALQGALDHFKQQSTSCFSVGGAEYKLSQIDIYPQPASDILFLEGIDGELIEVYNLNGIKVYSKKMESKAELDVSNWPAGVYVMHTANGLRAKLIIQ